MIANRGFEIIIKDLTYHPKNRDFPVLDNINLKISSGEFVAVVGLNGAGKSTLLKIISGLINKDYKGTVLVNNKKVKDSIFKTHRFVGVVNQDEKNDLISHLSVAQNIAIRQILSNGHCNKYFSMGKDWEIKLREELQDQDLAIDPDILCQELAGGLKQKLAVSIATDFEHGSRNKCRLLLLDEHTSKLDHIAAPKVMEYTAAKIHESNTTAIMVTHRYKEALQYAERIIILSEGIIKKDFCTDGKFEENDLINLIEGE